jgi:hypothetical protein
MRQLHPVSIHEKFVASGLYIYNQPSGITEEWSIHQLPDASRIIRIDQAAAALTLLVEALCTGEYIDRFDVLVYAKGGYQRKQARASYIVFDDRVHVGRTLDDAGSLHEQLMLPVHGFLCPPGLVFLGTILQRIAILPAPDVPIVTLFLANPDSPHYLAPQPDYFHVSLQEVKEFMIGGKMISAQGYDLLVNDASGQRVFWLDSFGVPVSVSSPGQVESRSALLTRYARSPEES